MWARVVEIMTAVWLFLSPFIFAAQGNALILWVDMGVAALITLLSSLSFWGPTRFAYLGNLLVALALLVLGRFSGEVPPIPPHQNHIFIGFFLLMIAIIPNSASQPPPAWQESVRN